MIALIYFCYGCLSRKLCATAAMQQSTRSKILYLFPLISHCQLAAKVQEDQRRDTAAGDMDDMFLWYGAGYIHFGDIGCLIDIVQVQGQLLHWS